jgi:hypothetical protein
MTWGLALLALAVGLGCTLLSAGLLMFLADLVNPPRLRGELIRRTVLISVLLGGIVPTALVLLGLLRP